MGLCFLDLYKQITEDKVILFFAVINLSVTISYIHYLTTQNLYWNFDYSHTFSYNTAYASIKTYENSIYLHETKMLNFKYSFSATK